MNPRLRVLIVDDEPLARGKLRTFAERVPDVQVVGECATVEEAVSAVRTLQPHLAFLDVEIGGGSGFDVIQQVGIDRMPATVFVTAYDQHALRAFEVHAIDYLLKPFDEERFVHALDRARRLVPGGRPQPSPPGLREMLAAEAGRPPRYPTRLVVRLPGGGFGFVPTANIEWIEAADNYVVLHEAAAKSMVRRTLASVQDELDPQTFLRVHRSVIVNVDKVVRVHVYSGSEYQLVMAGGTAVLTGRNYREQVRAALLRQGPFSEEA